jgi:Flp pilus assembly pilin Flp
MDTKVGRCLRRQIIKLADSAIARRSYHCSEAPPRTAGDSGIPQGDNLKMLNLVEKFTPEAEVTDDNGVVAIEYVVVAAAIVAALIGLFALGLGGILTAKLQSILNSF